MLGLPNGHSRDFDAIQHSAFTKWKVAFKRAHGHEPSAKSGFDFGVWWAEQYAIYNQRCIAEDRRDWN